MWKKMPDKIIEVIEFGITYDFNPKSMEIIYINN